MSKAEVLRNESADELKAKVFNLRKELFELTSERLEGKMPKTHLAGQKRKEIARILTILKEKEIKG